MLTIIPKNYKNAPGTPCKISFDKDVGPFEITSGNNLIVIDNGHIIINDKIYLDNRDMIIPVDCLNFQPYALRHQK